MPLFHSHEQPPFEAASILLHGIAQGVNFAYTKVFIVKVHYQGRQCVIYGTG